MLKVNPTLPKVSTIRPYMGCDPEFFIRSKAGEVIGAEKVIPKEGLPVLCSVGNVLLGAPTGKFIIDGVQAELNPRPNNCRANLANEIKACFSTLQRELGKQGATADFSRAVEISKENLMELDEESRKFGCAPSQSIYKKSAGLKINEVDPTAYRIRAAGGHIHIGKDSGESGLTRALTDDHKRTVAMLDLLVGNTSVLIDRDESNIERRKIYGKAGEYRLPKHGLEYRTLSNFWLTSYPLMSMAFGMVRLAVQLMADKNYELYFSEFMGKVKPKNVAYAINANDFDTAMENFKAVESLLLQVVETYNSHHHPIIPSTIKEFYHFVKVTKDKGITHWFPQDPMTHWTTIQECHDGGFYDFLCGTVRASYAKIKDKEEHEAKEAELNTLLASLGVLQPVTPAKIADLV